MYVRYSSSRLETLKWTRVGFYISCPSLSNIFFFFRLLQGIGLLARLQELDLSSNRLTSLGPKDLTGLGSLRRLSLANNFLTSISVSFFSLSLSLYAPVFAQMKKVIAYDGLFGSTHLIMNSSKTTGDIRVSWAKVFSNLS